MQFEFPSLDFSGRTVLYPHEVAAKLGVSVRHVYDLIDEGRLRAINLSGANNLTDRRCIRVPIEAYRNLVNASLN